MTRNRPAVSPMRKLTSALAALALALAGLTAAAMPARAQSNDDLVKFLFGAAALAVIAKSLSDSDKRRQAAVPVHPVRPHYPPVQPQRPHHPPAHAHRPAHLPAACAIQAGGRGSAVYYSERCLRGEGLRRLPQSCARSLRTARGNQTVYDGACLQNAGYRPERHRR